MSVGINHTNSNEANCFETTELRNWRESYSSRIDSILFLFYEPSSSIVRYIHIADATLKNPSTSLVESPPPKNVERLISEYKDRSKIVRP